MIQALTYFADVASLRIDCENMYSLFPNGGSDGEFTVTVVDGNEKFDKTDWVFDTCFGVKTTATISRHDCSDLPIFTLQKGRWGVYHNTSTGNMLLNFGGAE